MSRHCLFAVFIILPAGFMAIAQFIITDTMKIDEVVVTATRTLRPLKEVPGCILVVNAKAIEVVPFQQVTDIFMFMQGVSVSRSTGIYSRRPGYPYADCLKMNNPEQLC